MPVEAPVDGRVARTGVLFVNSPDKPGADTRIQALIMSALDRDRYDVHAACPGRPDAPTASFEMLSAIPGLSIRPTDFGPSLFGQPPGRKLLLAMGAVPAAASLLGLAAYIRRKGISILHSSERPRDAIPCAALARLTGAKSVIHVHVAWGRWLRPGVQRALRRADAVIGVSQSVAGSILAAGYPPERTHAVLNAIDASPFDPALDGSPVREELGLPPGAPVVVSISRLFHWKGHTELVRAFAEVRRELPAARLVIVGEQDSGAGPERPNYLAELKQLASDLGLEKSITFTGWRKDIPRVLAAADVFALPSYQEPFGLVFLEAMAMKKPVVALDSGGTPEVVEHGRSGLLSQHRDLPALAANLLALLRDPGLRVRMGEYGRQVVLTRFTPARMARDVERIYAGLGTSC